MAQRDWSKFPLTAQEEARITAAGGCWTCAGILAHNNIWYGTPNNANWHEVVWHQEQSRTGETSDDQAP